MPEQKIEYSCLRDAFCARYRCKPALFVTKVFWKCLPTHALIPSTLIGGPANRRFDHDTEVIAALADAKSTEDLNHGLDDLVGMQQIDHSRLRRWFRIRVSSVLLHELLLPLLKQVRRPEEPTLPEPAPAPVWVPSSSVVAPMASRTPETSSIRMRQVMRIHAAIIVGTPLERLLEEESLRASGLEDFLSEFSQLRPEAAWLLTYLRDHYELEQLRAEFKRQNRQKAQ